MGLSLLYDVKLICVRSLLTFVSLQQDVEKESSRSRGKDRESERSRERDRERDRHSERDDDDHRIRRYTDCVLEYSFPSLMMIVSFLS